MKTLSYFLSFLLLTIGVAVAQSDNALPPDKNIREHKMRMLGVGGMPGMLGLGHDWWRNSEIAEAINLSDAQKQQLSQIFASHRASLIQAKGNVELEEGKLRDLLDQDQPQQDQVLAEMTQLQNARNAMEKEFTIMSLAFRGVLSPDQWKKLQAVTRERMGKMFRMHHGGPGGTGNEAPPPLQ